jgi:hypothetical protein
MAILQYSESGYTVSYFGAESSVGLEVNLWRTVKSSGPKASPMLGCGRDQSAVTPCIQRHVFNFVKACFGGWQENTKKMCYPVAVPEGNFHYCITSEPRFVRPENFCSTNSLYVAKCAYYATNTVVVSRKIDVPRQSAQRTLDSALRPS